MILVLGHLSNFISYQSPSITQFILVTLPPYRSSNILSTLRPQGLCTAWNTLPSISHVAHIPPLTAGLCSNAIPSLISSLTIYLRYHTRLFPLLYLLFLQTTYHYYKIIKLLIFIFSTKLQAQKGQEICLLCSTPLYKTTVPSTSCSISI